MRKVMIPADEIFNRFADNEEDDDDEQGIL